MERIFALTMVSYWYYLPYICLEQVRSGSVTGTNSEYIYLEQVWSQVRAAYGPRLQVGVADGQTRTDQLRRARGGVCAGGGRSGLGRPARVGMCCCVVCVCERET